MSQEEKEALALRLHQWIIAYSAMHPKNGPIGQLYRAALIALEAGLGAENIHLSQGPYSQLNSLASIRAGINVDKIALLRAELITHYREIDCAALAALLPEKVKTDYIAQVESESIPSNLEERKKLAQFLHDFIVGYSQQANSTLRKQYASALTSFSEQTAIVNPRISSNTFKNSLAGACTKNNTTVAVLYHAGLIEKEGAWEIIRADVIADLLPEGMVETYLKELKETGSNQNTALRHQQRKAPPSPGRQ